MYYIQTENKALDHLQELADIKKGLVKKALELMQDIAKHPFEGKGKPEPLKGNLKGYWSRRINNEHRLIYKPEGDTVYIIACKGHYDDN